METYTFKSRCARLAATAGAATLALGLATGVSAATAAGTSHSKHKHKHHYVITSTGQIKPSVLSQLHGANGSNGANGAQGPQGATGATGATGAAGAVAGYSDSNSSLVTVPVGVSGNGTFVTVATKVLPPGSYLIMAKTSVNATANSGQTGNVAPECDLFFGGTIADVAQGQGPLGSGFLTIASYTTTLTDEAPLTSSTSTTVTLQCENQLGSQTNLAMAATDGQIEAVQTSHNS